MKLRYRFVLWVMAGKYYKAKAITFGLVTGAAGCFILHKWYFEMVDLGWEL